MNITFRKDAKLKDGTRIVYGTKATGTFIKVPSVLTPGVELDFIEVTIAEGTEVAPGQVLEQDLTFKTRKMSTFFKPPVFRTLEKYSLDGVAKSVTGKRCEPDGMSDDGAPSWLLVLGMI
ncbi:MAG: hypothetical protein WC919_08065 [Candidatus Paceibacterota bacterium]|jgi:hypothetical protein